MAQYSRPVPVALLGATLLCSPFAAARLALAADAPPVPDLKGKVAQYSLSPRGSVDGLILADGSEIRLPPHTSTQIVFAIHPGDAVTIRQSRRDGSMTLSAIAVTNDATGLSVDSAPPAAPQRLEDESRIKLQLHDADGRLNGVLLEDATIIRMPPADAEHNADGLSVGKPLFVSGDGIVSPLGKVVAARQIGPDRNMLVEINQPRYERWMHDVFGGGDAVVAVPPTAAGKKPL